ncbi:UNVERIFIED_CONTAM: hypothetical protein FKN15_039518 [Acipenser sinensis]
MKLQSNIESRIQAYTKPDYVYFENSSSNPYLIRRIEELNKTANGNVEAKVVSLFRRRDISSNLNGLADSNAREFEEESKQPVVSEQQGHQLKHRELFLSRQFESLPATHIRGKCNVTLLNETDVLAGYLEREDCFFYSLVFDPVQKTLLADQGEIRVGSKYQAEIPDMLPEVESDTRNQLKLETKVWDPDNPLTDRQIDQFLVVLESDTRNQLKLETKVWDPDNPLTDRQIDQFLVVARQLHTINTECKSVSAVSLLTPSRQCVIRLPKAPKLPLKVRAAVRPTLATIVKELAIQAPLKLKAPRGTPTPINRNQLNQSRASTNILGVKRPFENVGGGLQYSANGRPFTSGMRTTSQSVIKRQKVNPGDAPNPVVFVATKDTRYISESLSSGIQG